MNKMPEEKDVATETEEKSEVQQLAEETETSEESSTEKTEQDSKTGEVEKTQDDKSEETEEIKDDGSPIPFERFSKVNTQKNEFKTRTEELEAELEEIRGEYNDPDILRAVFKKRGLTEEATNAELVKLGHKVEEKQVEEDELFKQLSQGLDLNTKLGWFKLNQRQQEYFSKRQLAPIEQKLSYKDSMDKSLELEKEAEALSKELGIEFGKIGKTEKDINTGVGKIKAYMTKHPEHVHLGHPTLLRLALSEEGYKLGEEKGIKKERQRNKALKDSQVEDDARTGEEERPKAGQTIPEINAWSRRHPERIGVGGE